MAQVPADDDDPTHSRVIIHLDLDCFYAQVEQRRLGIPDGQPVAVQQWGSLLAVNYAARTFGVERGDFVDDARKKCPQIHLPHVDTLGENRKPGALFDRAHQKAILRRYRVASREIFAILGSVVHMIEKASVDEAFMDITDMAKERLAQTDVFSWDFCQDPSNHDTKVFGISSEDNTDLAFPLTTNERLLCIGAQISQEIRHAICSKLHFTCSTGIANNKLLAKLVSPLNKPNGQVVIAPRFVDSLMKSLPMRKIRGLGGKLGKQLESIYESMDSVAERPTEDTFQKLTAYTFLQRCGLTELVKHVGEETAAYVQQICQGNDGDEPVEEKKVLGKMFSCVKQFDQRSGSALVSTEQLEYWVRLLCEEMVMRCEDERVENKRFPSQLTIQFTRTGPAEKPRTHKLGVAQDTTADALHAAAMKVMRLHLNSVFPCATLSMHAKNFHALDSQAVATISSFFTRPSPDQQAASADRVARRMEEDMKRFAADRRKRSRDDLVVPHKTSKQKISAFFGSSSSSCNDIHAAGRIPPSATALPAVAVTNNSKVGLMGVETASKAANTSHFCEKCRREVAEPRAEHADFHFALQLSQSLRGESAAASVPRKKHGPLDAFLKR